MQIIHLTQSVAVQGGLAGKSFDLRFIHVAKTGNRHGCSTVKSRGPSRSQSWNPNDLSERNVVILSEQIKTFLLTKKT